MKGLRSKLLVSFVVFAAILVCVIMIANRQMLLKNLENEQLEKRHLIENNILTAMQFVDKAHLYFDTEITAVMEQELRSLRNYYEENPDIYSWDIEAIKERTNMEFYVIDVNNTVALTTYDPIRNYNFNVCCQNFVELLNERRESDTFFSDGLENSVATYDLWKYSYLSTPDYQYILELGVPVVETEIYQSFNFFEVANQLVESYADLSQLNVIVKDGFFLEEGDQIGVVENLAEPIQMAYAEAMETRQPTEYKERLSNHAVKIHRFLPYAAEVQRGISTERIIYMVFNNDSERALVEKNNRQFVLVFIVAIFTAMLLLAVILKMLTKTMYLATYDTLTGAYNRASYLQQMDALLQKERSAPIGLLLIDVDNFKQVNDQYGHQIGDYVLKEMAGLLQQITKKTGHVVRFGGDEFAIVLERANEEKLQRLAEQVLHHVRTNESVAHLEAWRIITASIGGAVQLNPKEGEEVLFSRADKALYESKRLGKNRYTFSN